MTTEKKSTRKAAGEDPLKRQQILDGARRVFMRTGYDAASMNDITREAGVSKGTIYVYFENKEDLFAALMEEERTSIVAEMRLSLQLDLPIEQVLQHFGENVVRLLCRVEHVRLIRIVLGIIDRIPEPSRSYLSCLPLNSRTILTEYLQHQVSKGAIAIEDCELAAQQFVDLTTGALLKKQLFCQTDLPPTEEKLHYVVANAVKLFMAGYGKK